MGIRPGARLAVVTVVSPTAASTTDATRSETALQRQMLAMLKRWAKPLPLDGHQVSYHALEDSDPAAAIVRYASTNNVGMIVMGAATHGLQLQRFIATVPAKVAMHAPCTVILVKQTPLAGVRDERQPSQKEDGEHDVEDPHHRDGPLHPRPDEDVHDPVVGAGILALVEAVGPDGLGVGDVCRATPRDLGVEGKTGGGLGDRLGDLDGLQRSVRSAFDAAFAGAERHRTPDGCLVVVVVR